jgi:hypothetical protein
MPRGSRKRASCSKDAYVQRVSRDDSFLLWCKTYPWALIPVGLTGTDLGEIFTFPCTYSVTHPSFAELPLPGLRHGSRPVMPANKRQPLRPPRRRTSLRVTGGADQVRVKKKLEIYDC